MENKTVPSGQNTPPGDSDQEQGRRLLAHSLLSSGQRFTGGPPMESPNTGDERLNKQVEAALSMRDFFRRVDLRSQAQDQATVETPARPVIDAQPLPPSPRVAVEEREKESPAAEVEERPEAPLKTSQGDPIRGDAQTAMERTAAVKEEVKAYSLQAHQRLEEARSAMEEAQRRYRDVEAELKRCAEQLAKDMREALQEVERLTA